MLVLSTQMRGLTHLSGGSACRYVDILGRQRLKPELSSGRVVDEIIPARIFVVLVHLDKEFDIFGLRELFVACFSLNKAYPFHDRIVDFWRIDVCFCDHSEFCIVEIGLAFGLNVMVPAKR